MATYVVVNQPVEINGQRREVGAVLDEADFKPPSGAVWTNEDTGQLVPELGELESLLLTKHVERVD